MVKAFDEAVFSMKPGEISAPVESEYGFHIIRLTAVNPAQIRSFNDALPDIERELKKQQVSRAYAELAEKANTVAFEQSDTLKPVADLLKQAPQRSGWITRNGAEDARLNNPKLLQAVFSEDVLVNKRNTEAVEVAPGLIVVARVVEHKPAAVQPFEQVQAAIEKKLVRTRANQLAAQEGRAQLEALRQGKDAGAQWSAPEVVSRANPKEMPGPVLREVFKADASKLPAYAGVEGPSGGYILLRISKVVEPTTIDKAQQNSLSEALSRMLGEEQFAAYLESLKEKTKVRINKDAIEKRQ
jgi:peptidyl-prolyl cis-trans isomerase D